MRKSLIFMLLAALLSAACANAPASPSATMPAGSPAVTPVASAVVVEASQPPATKAPRLHLEATDPSTVNLAAGRVQLVEFFAFW